MQKTPNGAPVAGNYPGGTRLELLRRPRDTVPGSRRAEKSDARICYRTAQPRFRWCETRRTAVGLAETNPFPEQKRWTFQRKVGFRCVTHGGQNSDAGPASTREILIPCAGLPSPPTPTKCKKEYFVTFPASAVAREGVRGMGGAPFLSTFYPKCPTKFRFLGTADRARRVALAQKRDRRCAHLLQNCSTTLPLM